ncbi:PAS domain S-box protein [Thermodesulfobacteriota bacterium]
MAKKPTYEELAQRVRYFESKRAKGEAKDNESNDGLSDDFKRLAERSQDVVYRYDIPSGKFLFFNRIGTKYGYGTKKSTLLLIHPDDRETVRKASKVSLAPGCYGSEVEYRICPSNGSIHWMHDRWSVIRDDFGRPLAIEGVISDNTERKLTQKALRESREQYRILVETMNDGLVVQDETYVFTYVNDKLCEMLGYTRDKLIGKPLTNFLDQEQQIIFHEQMSKRKRGEHGYYELIWTKIDDQKLPTIVSPQPFFDDNGNFRGSFGVITDISHLKEVERELKEREKELEIKTNYLEELNSALKVLLKRREEDKKELEQDVVSNVKELVAPYLKKLKNSRLDERQKALANIIEANLKEIISPFLNRISINYLNLTPTETQVANFVKQGKTTKEIADMLGLSTRTIESHRESIRKKLGIKNRKSNLRTHLLALQTKAPNTEFISVL